MKDTGFTLVELIAVIIILGIMALIVTPIITDVISNSREKAYNQQINEVLRSAERWAMSNSTLLPQEDQAVFYLSVPSLKDDGFVKNQDIQNPVTGEAMNGCILITYQKDSIQYDYSYEETSCSSTHAIDNLTNVYPEYDCYTFEPATGTITNYDTTNPICVTNVFIPNKIDGVNVLIIGTDAFRNKNITNVALPDYVVEIGDNSFAQNQIVSVNFSGLNDLANIGLGSFDNNMLTSVNLKNLPSLYDIEDNAFSNNNISSLKFSDLPALFFIGRQAFMYNNLTTVVLENLPKLDEMEHEIFAYNQINTVILRNLPELDYMCYGIFYDNVISSLTLVNLPQLYYIAHETFNYNNLTAVSFAGVPQLESIDDEAFENNEITSLNLTGLTNLEKIGFESFEDNHITSLNLTGLTNLTLIDIDAFYGNRLSSVTIPASVTTVGAGAFYQDVAYPWSSVTIGSNATNLVTRFNATWASIGWPGGLMPS